MMGVDREIDTANVEIFALHIFSRFLDIREYVYTVKITIVKREF